MAFGVRCVRLPWEGWIDRQMSEPGREVTQCY
jgi:hypothetical protein